MPTACFTGTTASRPLGTELNGSPWHPGACGNHPSALGYQCSWVAPTGAVLHWSYSSGSTSPPINRCTLQPQAVPNLEIQELDGPTVHFVLQAATKVRVNLSMSTTVADAQANLQCAGHAVLGVLCWACRAGRAGHQAPCPLAHGGSRMQFAIPAALVPCNTQKVNCTMDSSSNSSSQHASAVCQAAQAGLLRLPALSSQVCGMRMLSCRRSCTWHFWILRHECTLQKVCMGVQWIRAQSQQSATQLQRHRCGPCAAVPQPARRFCLISTQQQAVLQGRWGQDNCRTA